MSWKKYDILSRILSIILMGVCLFYGVKLKGLLAETPYEYKDDFLGLCIVLYAIGIVFNVYIVYCIIKGKQNDVFRILTSCIMLPGVTLATISFLCGALVLSRFGFLALIVVNIILLFIFDLNTIVSLANVFRSTFRK